MKAIRKIKSRYYFREALKYLLIAGGITITGSASRLALQFWIHVFKDKKPQKRKHIDMFRYLKGKKLLQLTQNGHDVHIALTREGKKEAGKYQIDDLRIERPKTWDKKWRLVIFDIPIKSNLVRNVFRAKIKEFGFYPIQKSTWLYPFQCKEEIVFLREFLGANQRQIQILEVTEVENENFYKSIFHLS